MRARLRRRVRGGPLIDVRRRRPSGIIGGRRQGGDACPGLGEVHTRHPYGVLRCPGTTPRQRPPRPLPENRPATRA
ncbi:hypothetical protein SGPA1_12585 [Streptomyces misionensis JCM 4497]